MKIYISADIEGIAGINHWRETDKNHRDFAEFQEQMTDEVAAACEGALEAGAKEIWVKDAHDSGRNIIAKRLPQTVRLIRGWSGHPFCMVQELDESFQAVMFIGYHARAGIDGSPLAHTLNSSVFHTIKLNGTGTSEFLLHSYAAASVGVPSVFLSGDEQICQEVKALNENIETFAVKKGMGSSTISLHPQLAVVKIREGVKKALSKDIRQCRISVPDQFTLEIDYKDHFRAYRVSFYPGAQLINPHVVEFKTNKYFEVMRFLMFA